MTVEKSPGCSGDEVDPEFAVEPPPVTQPADNAVSVLNDPSWCGQKPAAAQACIPECGGNPGGPGCDDNDSSGIALSSFTSIMLATMGAVLVGPFLML